MKFKVGDRVEYIGEDYVEQSSGRYKWSLKTGAKGTVVKNRYSLNHVAVSFDKNIGGHQCNGETEHGHGRVFTYDKTNYPAFATTSLRLLTKWIKL